MPSSVTPGTLVYLRLANVLKCPPQPQQDKRHFLQPKGHLQILWQPHIHDKNQICAVETHTHRIVLYDTLYLLHMGQCLWGSFICSASLQFAFSIASMTSPHDNVCTCLLAGFTPTMCTSFISLRPPLIF